MKFFVALTLFFVVVLTGCAGSVKTTISTFRSDTGLAVSGTIRVMPAPDSNHDELEFKYFADKLAAKLSEQGYVVSDSATTDYLAYLDYESVRQEKAEKRVSGNVHGTFGYHYQHAGVVFVNDNRTEFEFVRGVVISIVKNEAGGPDPRIKIAAVSAGKCAYLAPVYDAMLRAIFSNLQRENGSVVRVAEKTNRSCVQ